MVAEKSDKEFEKLKLLFEYTKFHILLYTTLITLLIGLFAFGMGDDGGDQFRLPMKIVVFFFVIAGGAGGVIGSSIPSFDSFSEFSRAKISPYNWGFPRFKGSEWVNIEHGAFWIGILIAVSSFLFI
jgi:hypothetical protein